jgi:SAM-dependent methyltransferase
MPAVVEFTCNICGSNKRSPLEHLSRERGSCDTCGSSVRTRSLLRTLSLELFQVNLTLAEFPTLKSLRGLGISDIPQYSGKLEAKFDYHNTFYDRAPQLDLMNLPPNEAGQYDFVISSDVLEHVPPPVETAFQNAYQLLKPGGVAILSVPYSIEDAGTIEHFPQLNEFSITDVGGRSVLVNRTAEGQLQIFENLVFHVGTAAPSLEMREFSERGLRQLLTGAGFNSIRWHTDEFPPYGIVWHEPWSLPFAIRKGPPWFGADTIRELMGELKNANHRTAQQKSALEHYKKRRWIELGRKLGLLKS